MLTVREIHLASFMTHEDSVLHLPPAGIVVIEGVNGSGKSAFIEGVAFALWGKTLRGDAPWTPTNDKGGVAGVRVEGLEVERTRSSNGKVTLHWQRNYDGSEVDLALASLARLDEGSVVRAAASVRDDGTTKFPTTSKAQEDLQSFLPDFDVWRRARVFSSSDAASFSGATDGDRKRLFERILNLDKFDTALEECREDLKAIRSARDVEAKRLELANRAVQDSIDRTHRAVARLNEASGDMPPAAEPLSGLDAAELEALVGRAAAEVERTTSAIRKQDRARADASARVRQAEREIASLHGAEACPTCGVATATSVLEALEAKAIKARDAARETEQAALDLYAKHQEALDELKEEERALRSRLAARRTAEATAAATARLIEQWSTAKDRAHAELVEAEAELLLREQEVEAAEAAVEARSHDVAVRDRVEQVLGLRGVRAMMLGSALGGLEHATNARLAALSPTIRVQIKATSEKKTGGVTDAISLGIVGEGGGTYRSLSGGQRRRVDLALLLGLADVAEASRDAKPGTLFLDEVLDTLDEDGIDAATDLAAELAQDRCVVVITHLPELARRLPAVHRVRIEAGRIVQ